MTKRQLRKEGYRLIVREGRGHQQVYDELHTISGLTREETAEVLSKIPSAAKRDANRALRGVYIGLMALVIVLRLLTLGVGFSVLPPVLMLLLLAVGVLVPALAIFGAVQHRTEFYQSTAILLGITIVRSLQKLDVGDTVNLAILGLYAVAVAFGILIPMRLKTPYDSRIETTTDETGKERKSRKIVFHSDERQPESELLDSGF